MMPRAPCRDVLVSGVAVGAVRALPWRRGVAWRGDARLSTLAESVSAAVFGRVRVWRCSSRSYNKNFAGPHK